MTSRTLKVRSAAIGAALLFAATAAVARGPGGPPAAGGGLVEHALMELHDKLALDSSQQVMFDTARQQMSAFREQARANHEGVRARIDAELAKAEPDLGALATALDGLQEQGRAARLQVRDQWLRLYANLRPDQKAIVRDSIKARIAAMDEFRQRGREPRVNRPS